MKYFSTKCYGHDVGLSCAFRQWRAKHSHCQYLHGYAISVQFVFAAAELDERNWVVDFGGLSEVKEWLKKMFDHKTLVAADDPDLQTFHDLDKEGVVDLVVLPDVGCEAFAQFIYEFVSRWLHSKEGERVKLVSVEVKEHGANSAGVCKPESL